MKRKMSFKLIFGIAMTVIYLAFGLVLLLTKDILWPISGAARIGMGVLILLFGLYRLTQVYSWYIEQKNIDRGSIMTLLILVLSLQSCGYKNPSAGNSSNDTTLVGVDETVTPVIQAEADVFQVMDTLGTLKIDYIPEGKAIKNVLDLKSMMAVATRQLTQKEVDFLKDKSYVARQTWIASDAIALITNLSQADTILSEKNVRDILTGKITNWNQLNKKNPSQPIKIVFDNQNSSLVRYMADSICKGQKLAVNTFAMDVNRDVIDYVARTPGVLGFIGTSWIVDKDDSLHLSFHKKIKVMSISPGEEVDPLNSFKPYQAYISDGVYPFGRKIYTINIEPVSGKASRFASFIAGNRGQRIILKTGIVPAIAQTRVVSVRSSL
ncbi:MAG: substrate-binding domain-containing protein [Bacteroidota bacterium]|nr:substrate-binding domain-containing protein [Bacteroidota bacterium]